MEKLLRVWEGRPNIFESPAARAHSFRRKLRQYAVASAACMSGLIAGTAIVFEMFVVMKLEEDEIEVFPRMSIIFLFLSAIAGSVTGAAISGLLAHFWGRKPAVILLAVPFILSNILLFISFSKKMMYPAWFCAGFGMGGVFTITPVYVSEVADDSARGSLGSLLRIMFNTGILLTLIATMTDNLKVINLCCLLVAIVFLAAAVWIPETPQFLYSHGRLAEADCSLQWLRGKHCKWLKEMQQAETAERKKIPWRELLSDRSTNKALGIALGLVILQELCEVRDQAFKETTIFEEAGVLLPVSVVSVSLEWTSLVTSLAVMFVVDTVQRKVLLVVSNLSMACCLGVMSVLCYLRDEVELDVSAISWLPLVCGLLYTVMFNLGLGPLPWVLMAELLPPGAKSVTSSLVSATSLILSPISSKVYEALVKKVGAYFSNAFFSVLCILSTLYVIFIVPETKGKTLEEIQSELSGIQETRL